jgi:hypothetical protein
MLSITFLPFALFDSDNHSFAIDVGAPEALIALSGQIHQAGKTSISGLG